MKKFKEFKERIKNPPPDRLAKIEFQSHFLQIIGTTIVCLILILKGFWYIVFAFIFSLGVSYSQGMSAYKKYHAIKNLLPNESPKDFQYDISPTRKRSNIIYFVFGSKVKWISLILSVSLAMLLFWDKLRFGIDIMERVVLTFYFLIILCASFILLYFFIAYWIAYPIYKRRVNELEK